jgi:hypothetical protein
MWAESGPSPRWWHLAIWTDEANSVAQLVFVFSRALEFQQQWDLGSTRSRHPVHAFSSMANQIGYLIPLQRARRLPAFLQA